MYEWIVWLALMIACLILEALSMQLFSIWFAFGALAALLASLFGAELWLQIILFLVVTVVSLLATRPLTKRLRGKKVPTNADRCVGQTVVVLEDIDNINGTGLIKVEGQIWTARTADGNLVPAGDFVRTLEIQGAKLLVEPLNETLIETLNEQLDTQPEADA